MSRGWVSAIGIPAFSIAVLLGAALAQGARSFNVNGRNLAGTGPWTASKSFSLL